MAEYWFSTAQLAELLEMQQSPVTRRLVRNAIPGRKRAKGKGLEYCLTDLPEDWQAVIVEKLGLSIYKEADHVVDASEMVGSAHPTGEAIAVDCEVVEAVEPVAPVPSNGAWLEIVQGHEAPDGGTATRRLQARLLLLLAVPAWCEAQGIAQKTDCEYEFCKAFNRHLIELPTWIYDTVSHLSRSTLHNWRRLQKDDVTGLKGKFAKEKGGLIHRDLEIRSAVEAAVAYIGPTAGVSNTLRVLRAELKPERVPSYAQLLRFLQDLRGNDPATWLRLTNPKAHRNSMAVALGSRSRGLWPNDRWEIDFTRNDILLQIGETTARFSVGLCIDVATRRMKAIVSPAPKGATTAELLARCVLDWGVPRVLVPDNGKEFINERVTRFGAALGVVISPPPPGTPQGKPHVERAFNFLNRTLETMPSFVGHNTGQRAEIRDHKGEDTLVGLALDAATFQVWLDSWCQEVEHEHEHSSLNRTPAEQLAHFVGQGWQPEPCPLAEAALAELCYRSWERRVGRSGISIDGRKYLTERLGDLVGQEVVAFEIPEDICRVRLYSPDLAACYGEATWEIYLTAAEQAEMAAKAKAIQAEVNAKLTLAKRRGKRLEGEFAKRPDRLLSATARQEALQVVAEELRPDGAAGLVAVETAVALPPGHLSQGGEGEPEEEPNRFQVPWHWFAYHYRAGHHQADPELRKAMAMELTSSGRNTITGVLKLDADAAYALGIEFGLSTTEADALREGVLKKERANKLWAEQRRRFA